MNNVLFEDCQCKYINLSKGRIKNTFFDSVKLPNAVFNETIFKQVEFSSCNLQQSEFLHTPLANIDFCSCDISGALVSISDLKDVIVTVNQAAELAKLMGIKISY